MPGSPRRQGSYRRAESTGAAASQLHGRRRSETEPAGVNARGWQVCLMQGRDREPFAGFAGC